MIDVCIAACIATFIIYMYRKKTIKKIDTLNLSDDEKVLISSFNKEIQYDVIDYVRNYVVSNTLHECITTDPKSLEIIKAYIKLQQAKNDIKSKELWSYERQTSHTQLADYTSNVINNSIKRFKR